ncbi:ATPase, T2SS/T4P/T4SS family [Psychrobacter celer]|uniref:ATPase, T2SS/T4P/T4SS family n=1 Tax=Psychrobacter celer TaxID=306572 RepID=UPI003FD34447
MNDTTIKRVAIQTRSQERNYVTKAPSSITGTSIPALDWLTQYKDPARFSRSEEIEALFHEISKHKDVSDIIIRPDAPICLKIKRRGLRAITHRIMDNGECESIIRILTLNNSIMNTIRAGETVSGLARILSSTDDGKAIYSDSGGRMKSRYRYEVTGCASPKSEVSFSAILRPLPVDPLPYHKLGMDVPFIEKCIVKDGTVIFAGATGEGKSTSLAAIIRYIAENDTMIKGNLYTHEDPIEVSYDNIRSTHSLVMQSSIGQGQNIKSFDAANRSAMRRSPDLVLVGELRDGPTVEAAVELSLTGHPVFATTHANNISAILPRLISRFPQEIQPQKAYDIIETARMFVAQKLIWNTEGNIFAVRETLKFTNELRYYLLDILNKSGQPDAIYKKIAGIMKHGYLGSTSYERQGKELLESGYIDEENYRYLVEGGNVLSESVLAQLNQI